MLLLTHTVPSCAAPLPHSHTHDKLVAASLYLSMGLSLPGLALAHQLYVAVQAQGHGRLGTHALMLALEQLNGIKH